MLQCHRTMQCIYDMRCFSLHEATDTDQRIPVCWLFLITTNLDLFESLSSSSFVSLRKCLLFPVASNVDLLFPPLALEPLVCREPSSHGIWKRPVFVLTFHQLVITQYLDLWLSILVHFMGIATAANLAIDSTSSAKLEISLESSSDCNFNFACHMP